MVDDIVCDAQDAFFDGNYSEAISLASKAVALDGDDDAYELLVLSLIETERFGEAFVESRDWHGCTKSAGVKAAISLLRTAYLVEDTDAFTSAAEELLSAEEDVEEVLLLCNDLLPDRKEFVLRAIEARPESKHLSELRWRITSSGSEEEREHRVALGDDEVYMYGVVARAGQMLRHPSSGDASTAEQWEAMVGDCPSLQSVVDVLGGRRARGHGLHLIVRRWSACV